MDAAIIVGKPNNLALVPISFIGATNEAMAVNPITTIIIFDTICASTTAVPMTNPLQSRLFGL